MSADAKALRLFGVARDSVEVSAAGQPEPEPEPQPERPPSCATAAAKENIVNIVVLVGIGLILYNLLCGYWHSL